MVTGIRTSLPWEEVPESSTIVHHLAIAFCEDCNEPIGPGPAEDVGYSAHEGQHAGHEVELLKEWKEEQEVGEEYFDIGSK